MSNDVWNNANLVNSVTFSVCFHLEILLLWQRDVMISPLYQSAIFYNDVIWLRLQSIHRPCHVYSQCNSDDLLEKPFAQSAANLRGGSRRRVQGVRTFPRDDLRFSNTTGILPLKPSFLKWPDKWGTFINDILLLFRSIIYDIIWKVTQNLSSCGRYSGSVVVTDTAW